MRDLTIGWEPIWPEKEKAVLKPLTRDLVTVSFSGEFGRAHSDSVDAMIDAERSTLLANSRLYAGRKYRLASACQYEDTLHLYLGETDYITYLATNYNKELNDKLIKIGLIDYGDQDAYLSNAIGNVAVVLTIDGKTVLVERSTNVATFQGWFDLPGGHPEPDDAGSLAPRRIVDELFASVTREVRDELNIQQNEIIDLSLMAIIRNIQDGRKPEMVFLALTRLSTDDIMQRYNDGGAEKYEVSTILFVDPFQEISDHLQLTAPASAGLFFASHLCKNDLIHHLCDSEMLE